MSALVAVLATLVSIDSSALIVTSDCHVGPRTTRAIIASCTASLASDAQPELECVQRQLERVCDVTRD